LHVLLGDAALGAGAGDEGDVDAQLLGELFGRRGGEDALAGGPRGGAGRRLGGSGGGGGGSRRGGRGGAAPPGGGVLARFADHGHGVQALGRAALGHRYLQQRAGGGGLDGVGELVGLNFEKGLALLDGVALVLQPFADRALGHGQAQLGHYDHFSH